ncbi:MAG: hypothetical protein JHD28_00055 [Bacteroidia bacterium]|nr:hypothetical protein [Bacteroidia bacterium]
MNKRQKAKRNAYGKLLIVLGENTSVVNGYKALENNITKFENQVQEIDDTNDLSVGGRGKGNQLKTQAFETMVTYIVALSKKALAWAMETKNPQLVDFYSMVKTDFDDMSGSDVISMAENLVKGLEKDVANLADYNITAAQITNAQGVIDAYKTENPAPMVRVKKTAEANKKLVQLFTETDETVKKIVSLIEGEYYETNADFVSLVQSAKAIDTIGSRGTKITFYITNNAGNAVPNVLGDIVEMTDEEQYSNAKGEIIMEDMKAGDYTYVLTHDGKKQSGKFSIKTGEQLKVKVVM